MDSEFIQWKQEQIHEKECRLLEFLQRERNLKGGLAVTKHEEAINLIADLWKQEQEQLHEKEKRLIEFIRELQYGEVVIKVQDGLPVMVEKATEKVKL